MLIYISNIINLKYFCHTGCCKTTSLLQKLNQNKSCWFTQNIFTLTQSTQWEVFLFGFKQDVRQVVALIALIYSEVVTLRILKFISTISSMAQGIR